MGFVPSWCTKVPKPPPKSAPAARTVLLAPRVGPAKKGQACAVPLSGMAAAGTVPADARGMWMSASGTRCERADQSERVAAARNGPNPGPPASIMVPLIPEPDVATAISAMYALVFWIMGARDRSAWDLSWFRKRCCCKNFAVGRSRTSCGRGWGWLLSGLLGGKAPRRRPGIPAFAELPGRAAPAHDAPSASTGR